MKKETPIEDTKDLQLFINLKPVKRQRMQKADHMMGWNGELLTKQEFNEVTPHPWKPNEFRTNCEFYNRGAFRICIYSKCKENGDLIKSGNSNHKYAHCCCQYHGERCQWEQRMDQIKDFKHDNCLGEKLELDIVGASSEMIEKAIANFARIHNIPFEVCASPEMRDIIIKSMNLQYVFSNEISENLAPELDSKRIRLSMIDQAHENCFKRLQQFRGRYASLILDGGMISHTHVVAVLLTSPMLDCLPLLLTLHTGNITSDGYAKLVSQISLDLTKLEIIISGSTTDGATALAAGLSLFSPNNYSKYLTGKNAKLLYNRCADHLLDRAFRNAICPNKIIDQMINLMNTEINSLHSMNNEKEIEIYARSFSKTRWIGLFLSARWLVMHKDQILKSKLKISVYSLRFTEHFYYITKPLFETVSKLESNTASICQDRSDLFATAFALSYPGQQLMISGSIGSVQASDQNVTTFLSTKISSLIPKSPVVVHELDEDESKKASLFEAEAYEFLLGNYCRVKDSLLLINPFVYWMSVKKGNSMKQCFADFALRILSLPASEAGCERIFSEAKRVLGLSRHLMSLQTIFCHLV
ncbi:MAG: hypothetical protein EZS28_027080 [Streblomastix strix]|uniref:Uncharacterized protein n=1 Tax=Streblomastix strix TaxID=222440 RepID=A0A5J4V4C9_9EUKA|nr:MAG: hypothetical protein EZS28_027080 [Streblomastix strix]